MSHAEKSAVLDELLVHLHRILGTWISTLDASNRSSESSVVTNFAILALVNDVTDIKKSLVDSIGLSVTLVDVSALGKQALSIFEGGASPDVALLFVSDLGNPEQAEPYLDYSRCLQVVVHLLRNALRHTEAGAVILKIGLEAEDTYRFSVQDTGSGVAPSKQNSVLAALEADSSVWEHLGLGLCSRIVRYLGGQMGMNTVCGSGSVFWFTCVDFSSVSYLRICPDPSSDLKS